MYPFKQIEGAVAHDPNNIKAIRRSHRGTRISRALTFWPFWICPIIGFLLSLGMGAEAGIGTTLVFTILGFAAAMFFGSIGINLTIAMNLGDYTRRTMKPPADMDPYVVEKLVNALVDAARTGLDPKDRPALQRMLDDSDAVLTAMTGTTPYAMLDEDDATKAAGTLDSRARRLEAYAPDMIDLLRVRGGAKHYEFVMRLRPMIRLIETTAIDLGLDPAGFGPARDAIPQWSNAENIPAAGKTAVLEDALAPMVETPESVDADDASPAQKVRRLGRIWLNGPRFLDDTTAMEADAACGRDVDDIESRWRMARRHAVAADIEQIDRDFSESCEILSTRLETAIALRSAMLRDELTSGRRYIESKHARD